MWRIEMAEAGTGAVVGGGRKALHIQKPNNTPMSSSSEQTVKLSSESESGSDSAIGPPTPDAPGERSGMGLKQPTRLTIVQPSLPKYRVGPFSQLARRPNVRLRVIYGDSGTLPNIKNVDFEAELQKHTIRRVMGHPLYWHQAHLDEATPERCDVLFMTWDVHFLSLLPAIRRARKRGVKVVLWGFGYGTRENKFRRSLRNFLGRRADALLVYNHESRRRLLEDGFDPDRVFVALNTVDTSEATAAAEEWRSAPEQLAAYQAEHDLTPHTLLHVSRWVPARRVELLFEAVSRLKPRFPDVRLVLVGKRHDRPEARALAERLGIADAIQFTGPIYDEQELAPLFLSSRAMVFADYIGLGLQHAFAYGLPVVTHGDRRAHAPEVEALVEEETGLMFPPGNVDAIAKQLARLLGDDELFTRLSSNARDVMRERFTLANMVDGFVAAAEAVTTARS